MLFTIFGNNSPGGTYLIFVGIHAELAISFGRFHGGRPVTIGPGTYAYVGSALGGGPGRHPLAARLLRHASRSGEKMPHAIRDSLEQLFAGEQGTAKKGRGREKRLHWHIDYLLDREEAEISHIVLVRHPARLEERLAGLVAAMPGAVPVADRLGAQDARSGTHLFRIDDPATVTERLNVVIPSWIQDG